ncbi:MAG: DNA polymerase III subunit delta [Candidatus Saccharimonadales bacterium]
MILAFIGDNGHAREQAAREFIDAFIGMHGTVAVDRFSGEELELSTLTDAISSIPFLSERRLVIVRDFSTNKQLTEQFEAISQSVADAVDFVIIEGHVDGRSKYLSTLKKLAEVREFSHLEGDDLVAWVVEQTRNLKGTISRSSAQALIERVGTNQQLLANELAKLVLYNPDITSESIQNLTAYAPQSSIFTMLDAAFAGKVGDALKLYAEQRMQGMEPQAILGMVVWQLHSLAIVKTADSMSAGDIASSAKMSPFVVRKNQTTAKRLSDAKLLQLFEHAIATDTMLKSTSVNADDAVRTLITSFA